MPRFDYALIMVIDDDPEDIEFFLEALFEINPTVVCKAARSGEEALMRLRTLDPLPRIVFLDHNMPKMNGLQVLQAIRDDERLKHLEVIMYSTVLTDSQREAYSALNARYMQKHSGYHGMVAALRDAIGDETSPVA